MRLSLVRDTDDGQCSLGILSFLGETFHTIERPWIPDVVGAGGRKGVSCVPKGIYRLVPHDSEAHPKVWALVNPKLDVYHFPDDAPIAQRQVARTAVLIHPANWASELRGCIAPGMARQRHGSSWMVTGSRSAMHWIQMHLTYQEHELEIA